MPTEKRCGCNGWTQSCKDEHEKTLELLKGKLTTSQATTLLILFFFIGGWVPLVAGCMSGVGCGKFCCLIVLMMVMSGCTAGIGAIIWGLAWTLDLKTITSD